MTDPKDLNLTKFDLAVYYFATQELNIPEDETFEVSVEVAKQDSSKYIPIDDFDLSSN